MPDFLRSVDLLMGGDGKLELLDFKAASRATESPELIAAYERPLCTYAHIVERRHGKRPERLLLYWTAEARKEDAVMELPYRPGLFESRRAGILRQRRREDSFEGLPGDQAARAGAFIHKFFLVARRAGWENVLSGLLAPSTCGRSRWTARRS